MNLTVPVGNRDGLFFEKIIIVIHTLLCYIIINTYKHGG